MLNPSLNNFRVSFSLEAFPKELTEKYDAFLFQQNTPFKTIQSHILESLQSLTMPGINLNTITIAGLNNLGKNPWAIGGLGADKNGFPHSTINATYPGTAPLNEVVDSITANISFRNTIINWCYFYELFYTYYKRTRELKEFAIYIDMYDSARLPMIRFSLGLCFVATIPGLEFAANQNFNDTKTFDISFVFNKFDVEFLVPGFKQEILSL